MDAQKAGSGLAAGRPVDGVVRGRCLGREQFGEGGHGKEPDWGFLIRTRLALHDEY